MSTNSSSSPGSGAGTENPGPWIAGVLALMGFGVWTDRNHWYAALAPYGLTSEETRTVGGRVWQ